LGELDAAQVASEAERLGTVADQLIAGRTVYAPNRRLLDHLGRERGAVYFLGRNEVQATNWRAEHAIGPASSAARPGWQLHLYERCDLAGAVQHPSHRPPVAARPVTLLLPLREPGWSWPTLPSPVPRVPLRAKAVLIPAAPFGPRRGRAVARLVRRSGAPTAASPVAMAVHTSAIT